MFIRADRNWNPRCGAGTRRELADEAVVLQRQSRWIIDPATVCLVIECGLESIFRLDCVRPWVSKQTRHVLREWQLREHDENLGRRGSAHLTDSGRVVIIESSVQDRQRVTGFWNRLWRFVHDVCLLAPPADDETMAGLCEWASILDIGTISAIAIAKSHSATLLSDELAVRSAANALGADSASLRGALGRALEKRQVSMTEAVDAFAALASTGRGFLSLPFDLLRFAILRMPANLREPRVKTLLSTLKLADPVTAWPQLLSLLLINRQFRLKDRRMGMNDSVLLRLVLHYAPRPDPALAKAIRHAVIGVPNTTAPMKSWNSRIARAIRRALGRYLSRNSSKER